MKSPRRKDSTVARSKTYQVHGVVTGVDGKELSGAEVIVWWQRMRKRVQLAKGRASEDGRYRLKYSLPEETQGQVLIVVQARSNRLQAPLESPVTAAQASLQIDLAARPADDSEFATLLQAITPQLGRLSLVD